MKKRLIMATIIVGVLIGLAVPAVVLAEPRNSINLTGAAGFAPDASASGFFVEYERLVGEKVSLLGRFGSTSYSFDDSVYVEDGDGSGVDLGVRLYPQGGMKGLYFGGSLGFWSSDWTFTDDMGTFYQTTGTGSSDAVRLDLEIGGRFNLGSGPVSLMPSFHLGNYFSVSDDCTYTSGATGACDNSAEFNLYAYLGLAVGFAF